MSLRKLFNFDIQFFGGGGSAKQYRKRDPEPEELGELRKSIYEAVSPTIGNFGAGWQKAQDIANNAMDQQSALIGGLQGSLDKSNGLLDEMMNVVRTGNVPSALTDNMNASVNRNLQSGMGSMLNNLAGRGVVNSSIASKGVNNLAQNAANAYADNYLSALQTTLGGYAQGLSGAQGNTSALLNGIGAMGSIPAQAYEGASAALTPAYNFWNAWQRSYDSKEDYDTVVKQGK